MMKQNSGMHKQFHENAFSLPVTEASQGTRELRASSGRQWNRQNMPVDERVPLWHHPGVMIETTKRILLHPRSVDTSDDIESA
jgi:hypothetical protein